MTKLEIIKILREAEKKASPRQRLGLHYAIQTIRRKM